MSNEGFTVVGIGGTLRESSASLGALKRTLRASEAAGARTLLLDLRELKLPMYVPGQPVDSCDENVARFLEAVRKADAVVISTATYHGAVAGVVKNALDFTQFLARDERPYLDGKIVSLIGTAGGDRAAANAIGPLINVVHALRGMVAPLMVAVPKSWKLSDGLGNIVDENYGDRLDRLGRLVVDLATRISNERETGNQTMAQAAAGG
ncbi:NAD(P)H-dependent oxidoreductase [soil metagenome]